MAKYRKKPMVIEAEQYWPGQLPWPQGSPIGVCYCHEAGTDWAGSNFIAPRPHLHTIHQGQTVILEPGDWVIPEPDGLHYYPCKSDIFAATYEPVEEEPDANRQARDEATRLPSCLQAVCPKSDRYGTALSETLLGTVESCEANGRISETVGGAV